MCEHVYISLHGFFKCKSTWIPLDRRLFNATVLILYPVFGYVPADDPLFAFKDSLIFYSKINDICCIILCNFYLKRKRKAEEGLSAVILPEKAAPVLRIQRKDGPQRCWLIDLLVLDRPSFLFLSSVFIWKLFLASQSRSQSFSSLLCFSFSWALFGK